MTCPGCYTQAIVCVQEMHCIYPAFGAGDITDLAGIVEEKQRDHFI